MNLLLISPHSLQHMGISRATIRRASMFLFMGALLISGCTLGDRGSAFAEPEPERGVSPSSQPTSRPSYSKWTGRALVASGSPTTSHKAQWGEASFGLAISPQALHRPDKDEGVAVFAGGCFWCMEGPFEKLRGVTAVLSGYTGGKVENPTYSQVSAKQTDHLEAVLVFYHPSQVTYEQLLETYWQSINPTQADGQFADRGPQYLTAIFTLNSQQEVEAERSKQALQASGKFAEPIAVKLLTASEFWPAEDDHQDYYKTNPTHYQRYRHGSGRAGYLKKTWGVK